jgi:hypothetical protein
MNKKPHTFLEIFNLTLKNGEVVHSIEIPMIQRDYAQGRNASEINRIREKFLAVLHDALTGASDSVRLDFVYGDVTNGKLIPLDGQQRLTTLFLIHWYIAKKENISAGEFCFLKNFTYKTRPSSSRFCEKLLEVTPDFSLDKLSVWLEDQSWYLFSWEHDPTISSMLIMLDAIHAVFKDADNLWSKLVSTENPPISFFFLALEDMGLTDSLYIKMNSRGKPLTEFEHFKAEFEGMLKQVSEPLCNTFIHKADKDWVDMLWQYRGDDNAIDDEFMRYFRFVSEILCFQNEIEMEEDNFDVAYSLYSNQNENAVENLNFLFSAFDCWCNTDDIGAFFSSIFSEQEYAEGKVVIYSANTNIFLECCNKYGQKFTLNSRIFLYAILIYQIHKETIPPEAFKERMRIVRNLVMNSEFEIRIDRMNLILQDTKKIILNGEISLKTGAFNELQKSQEIRKYAWRNENPESICDLNRLEDHHLLRGTIAIIGLEEPMNLKNRVDQFYKIFSHKPDYIKISRALLTIQDYSQKHAWRFLLGDRSDTNWRDLFTESKQRKHFDRTQQTIIELLDVLIGSPDKSFDSIIEDYLQREVLAKDWKYYLIKYPKMRAGNYGRYFRRNDESYNLIMMNTASSTSGRHWCPYFYQAMKEPVVKDNCSLGEYGDPLVINPKQIKIHCLNDAWKITDMEDNEIRQEPIPQCANGFDTVDRVEHLIELVNKEIQDGE